MTKKKVYPGEIVRFYYLENEPSIGKVIEVYNNNIVKVDYNGNYFALHTSAILD